MKWLIIVVVLFNWVQYSAFAQTKLILNGYLSEMVQMTVFDNNQENPTPYYDNILHNRINMAYYQSEQLTLNLQLRNQLIFGQTMKNTPFYAQYFEKDKGMVDMNFNWFSTDAALLNTQIDRANLVYSYKNMEATLGRQRINWGRTLVWNPNDIFNAYSYYDFDYTEKPGSDALRLNYYTGTASSVELVVKTDSSELVSVAALGKMNKWGYDLQFLLGYVNQQDYVAGLGWEGNIKSLAFRGEMSYYLPDEHFGDTSGVFLASVSFDYLLPKNITVQAEMLYNDKKTLMNLSQDANIFKAPATSKSLSFSEFNFFVNLSWQALPILSVNIAGMYYPDYDGYFLMPGAELSIANDVYLGAFYQYFNLKTYGYRTDIHYGFARLKWNF